MKTLVALLALAPLAVAAGPLDGTWKFDFSKAKFSGKPLTFALQGGRLTCSTCDPVIDVAADGADQKVAGAKQFDTVAVKADGERTLRFTTKKGGEIVRTWSYTASADGKSLAVAYTDYLPKGEKASGESTLSRVQPGPAGAHAASGGWLLTGIGKRDAELDLVTYKTATDGISMTDPSGQSYEAKFDGKDYPLKGDRAGGTVAVRKIDESTIEETYKQDGKVVSVTRFAAKGNTADVVFDNVRMDRHGTYNAIRQ